MGKGEIQRWANRHGHLRAKIETNIQNNPTHSFMVAIMRGLKHRPQVFRGDFPKTAWPYLVLQEK